MAQLQTISKQFLCSLIFFCTQWSAMAIEPASPPVYKMELREAMIPMPDGVKLAVDLYMPTGAQPGQTFPVLLEYLPYRKTDARIRNWKMYNYFVERGYAIARVDIRGTGNSQGQLIALEYSDQELDDGEVIIDWLSKQDWSTGKVGMFGISWGGFNGIQMTMRNPPALKAIIAIDATEDLYQDDVHFMDGVMHVDSWEISQDLDNTRPGAPDYLIDEAYLKDRFDTEPWMFTYKAQQRDGPFWDRASLKGKYDTVTIPTFMIGGWYDGYRNAIPRMLQHLHAPVKAMVGPWSHNLPHDAYPKPGMEWRHEAVRWFDYWLRGKDTGIMDEPRFAVFLREWHPPGPVLEQDAGSWRWEDGWPLKGSHDKTFYPQPDHTLTAHANQKEAATMQQLRYLPGVGVEAGGPVMWWGDIAYDQRGTDACSLVYDSQPLTEKLEIIGLPKALLTVASDAKRADWVVRLSDVAPDGRVTLVTGAAFNGTHRNSAREPQDIQPGKPFALEIDLHFTSWVFAPGHRIRFAVNNAQWPMLWPTAYPMTTQLQVGGKGGSRFTLPVAPKTHHPAPAFLPPSEDNPDMPGFAIIDDSSTSGFGEISSVNRNPQTGENAVSVTNQIGQRFPWGTEHYQEKIEHKVTDDHPEAASLHTTNRFQVNVTGREIVWEAESDFHSDAENFYYDYQRRLSENGVLVREKKWTKVIPRDFQ